MRLIRAIAIAALLAAGPARAAVTASSSSSFNVAHEFTLPVPPAVAWQALAQPGRWWPKAHTWSGDTANLSIELHAGGCFCERWNGGSAAHGRVLMVRDHALLRIDAPLGPMQVLGVSALLTVMLEPAGAGTKAVVTFRASGDPSHGLESLAPVVDRVVGEQWGNWAAFAAKPADERSAPPATERPPAIEPAAPAPESQVERAGEPAAAAPAIGLQDGPIRSRLVGSVAGWKPGTVFELANGQRWKVLKGSADLPRTLESPEVLVVPGIAGRWFLQVDESMPKARVYLLD